MSLNGAANQANATTAAAVSDATANLVQQGLLQNAEQSGGDSPAEDKNAPAPGLLTLNNPALTTAQKAEIRRIMYATIHEWRQQKAARAEKRWTKRGLCAAGCYLAGRLLIRADKEGAKQRASPDVFDEVAVPLRDELRRQYSQQERQRERHTPERDRRERRRFRHGWPRVVSAKLLPRRARLALPPPRDEEVGP